MDVFDSHAHLIAEDDVRYPPAPLSGKLRDGDLDVRFPVEQLLRDMDANGVDRAVAVQRAHVYGYNNSYVCDVAERYPDRLTAVVAVDACAADAGATVRHWVGERGARGIRFAAINPQVKTADFCASDAAGAAWAAAEEVGASICIHVFRDARALVLQGILPLMRRHAGVPVVIDHVANAPLGEAGGLGFDDDLKAYMALPSAYLKFTTINARKILAAGADPAAILAELVARCPAGRVMWGSDVAQTKGTYAEMVGLARQAARELAAPAQASFLKEAGMAFYGAKVIA